MPVEIRKRDMKLSDHNISRDKYNELKYFCLQYWQKKQEIDRNYGIDGFSQDGMPRGTSSSNPTEKKALRIAQLKRGADRADGDGSGCRNISVDSEECDVWCAV